MWIFFLDFLLRDVLRAKLRQKYHYNSLTDYSTNAKKCSAGIHSTLDHGITQYVNLDKVAQENQYSASKELPNSHTSSALTLLLSLQCRCGSASVFFIALAAAFP